MDIRHVFTLHEWMVQGEWMLRIIVACFLGMVIGYERKNRNKSAGIRTHAIVALGAALIMIVSKYGFYDIVEYDASRVAAQIVSGIGFLGAGIIFVRNYSVSGLTTAAGIWTTAGVGMALGSGLYFIGIAGTALVVLMQVVLHRVEFLANEAIYGELKMTVASRPGAVKDTEAFLAREKLEIISVKINKSKKEEIKLEFEVIFPPGRSKSEILAALVEKDWVLSIKE